MLKRWLLLAAVLSCRPAYGQSDLERCRQQAEQIKTGMTRDDVRQLMSWDGGIIGIYKEERFYFRNFYLSDTRVCKLVMDFRPRGMSAEVYEDSDRFSQWLKHRKEPQPIKHPGFLMKVWHIVSRPFRSPPPPKPQKLVTGGADDEVVRISPPYVELMIFD